MCLIIVLIGSSSQVATTETAQKLYTDIGKALKGLPGTDDDDEQAGEDGEDDEAEHSEDEDGDDENE